MRRALVAMRFAVSHTSNTLTRPKMLNGAMQSKCVCCLQSWILVAGGHNDARCACDMCAAAGSTHSHCSGPPTVAMTIAGGR